MLYVLYCSGTLYQLLAIGCQLLDPIERGQDRDCNGARAVLAHVLTQELVAPEVRVAEVEAALLDQRVHGRERLENFIMRAYLLGLPVSQ